MSIDPRRVEFERVMQLPEVLKHYRFPLGVLEVNGTFIRYMDSDTDSAWLGFKLGWTAHKRSTP